MYYNHTIHPELLRMERRRLRLIRLFVLSGLILAGIFLLEFYLDIWVLTLALAIPIGLFLFYLAYRIRLCHSVVVVWIHPAVPVSITARTLLLRMAAIIYTRRSLVLPLVLSIYLNYPTAHS